MMADASPLNSGERHIARNCKSGAFPTRIALPRIGFLAQASGLEAALQAGKVAAARIAETQILIFNARLDAFICAVFVILVGTILIDSIRIWMGILGGTRSADVAEAPFVVSRLSPEEV